MDGQTTTATTSRRSSCLSIPEMGKGTKPIRHQPSLASSDRSDRLSLRLRGTFIDIDEGSVKSCSPRGRAFSDPGSDRCSSSQFFQSEIQYVEGLNSRCPQQWHWSERSYHSRGESGGSTPGSRRLDAWCNGSECGSSKGNNEAGDEDNVRQTVSAKVQGMQGMIVAIKELPDHFGQQLDKVLAESRSRSTSTDHKDVGELVGHLEDIPSIVQASMDSLVATAQSNASHCVEGVIKALSEACLTETPKEQVIDELRAFPAKLQVLTKQIAEAAVAECKKEVEQRVSDVLQDAKEGDWPQPPETSVASPSVDLQAARAAVNKAVEQATGEVHQGMISAVANHWVADAILRAKASQLNDGTMLAEVPEVPSLPDHLNTQDGLHLGSMGHPECCARPCRFFAEGACRDGNTCSFCHRPHPKRPVHLDKQNRFLMKEMDFGERVAVLAPILEVKAKALGMGSDASTVIQDFSKNVGKKFALAKKLRRFKQGDVEKLSATCQAMTVNGIIGMLRTVAPTSAFRDATDVLQYELRKRNCSRAEALALSRAPQSALLVHLEESRD